MTHHVLKCDVRYFQNILDGRVRAINRYNDKGYKVGDTVLLKEGQIDKDSKNGFKYTNRSVTARICFIDKFGLVDGYLTLSLDCVGFPADDLATRLWG